MTSKGEWLPGCKTFSELSTVQKLVLQESYFLKYEEHSLHVEKLKQTGPIYTWKQQHQWWYGLSILQEAGAFV